MSWRRYSNSCCRTQWEFSPRPAACRHVVADDQLLRLLLFVHSVTATSAYHYWHYSFFCSFKARWWGMWGELTHRCYGTDILTLKCRHLKWPWVTGKVVNLLSREFAYSCAAVAETAVYIQKYQQHGRTFGILSQIPGWSLWNLIITQKVWWEMRTVSLHNVC